MTAFLETREERGIKILSKGKAIQKITKNHYRVLSQSQDKYYNVTKLRDSDVWVCECADFTYHLVHKDDKRCKHILACLTLQNTVEQELHIEKLDIAKICPKCNSAKIVKNGLRMLHNGNKRQRYACLQCNHKFTLHDSGFSGRDSVLR